MKVSAAAREASHQARGGAGQGVPTPTASCEGGAGVAVAAAAAMTMAAMSAGVPLYAQETWAARHSKVCKGDYSSRVCHKPRPYSSAFGIVREVPKRCRH